MGDCTIRRLLVIGAMSTTRWSRGKQNFAQGWLGRSIARKPIKLAPVALANKMARVILAVMTREETYRTGRTSRVLAVVVASALNGKVARQ
ncbi:hypothetical protein A1D31_36285 [Bradyrhizobium liaoningense]|nr:hypothetical protein A1D31_36285 [Bradyrhizobium liaoningense]